MIGVTLLIDQEYVHQFDEDNSPVILEEKTKKTKYNNLYNYIYNVII